MGRYDGEDYDYSRNCGIGNHNLALNGTCWTCHHLIICSYCGIGQCDKCHLKNCECSRCGVVVVRRKEL